MAAKETGKQRASQIELDHYKRHDLLWKMKIGLAAAAVVLTTGWWVWGVVRRDESSYSRGPVSAAHALWDNNCQVCHTEFAPMNERNQAAAVLGWSITSDQNCKSCHQGHHEGPTHHASQKWEPSCASCHREHRGRDASLTRLPDSDCTQCHANLPAHTVSGKTDYVPTVTNFPHDHPEFAFLRKKQNDPGRLKFNHKLHMTAGLVRQEGDLGVWVLGKIPEGQRERYRQPGQKTNDDAQNMVQLDCASCHQSDSTGRSVPAGLPSAVQPPRGSGEYMQPVVYEQHCQACHPLTFESGRAVRHRLQPDEIRDYLKGHYTARYLEQEPGLFQRPAGPRRMPGRPDDELTKKALDLIEKDVRAAERTLFLGKKTCAECHHYESIQDGLPQKIAPTNVPQVWLAHARFDHAAHRAVDCRQCHARAYAGDPAASISAEDVLIADGVRRADGTRLTGVQLCQQCHAPARGSGRDAVGGARFHCTECHRYHHGDQALHGLGARARDARHKLTLDEFLKGK